MLLDKKVGEFSKHQTFMIRIHCVFLMNSMLPHVSGKFISSSLSKALLVLAEDPVPNIRFNVSKSVYGMWQFMSKE
jgi:hypothetical protein